MLIGKAVLRSGEPHMVIYPYPRFEPDVHRCSSFPRTRDEVLAHIRALASVAAVQPRGRSPPPSPVWRERKEEPWGGAGGAPRNGAREDRAAAHSAARRLVEDFHMVRL